MFGAHLIGYFTLTLLSLDLGGLTASQARKLSGYAGADSCCVYVIGQLGKADDCEYEGGLLINTALEFIRAACEFVGGRAAMIECDNTEALVNFYTRNGFSQITPGMREKCRFSVKMTAALPPPTSLEVCRHSAAALRYLPPVIQTSKRISWKNINCKQLSFQDI